MSFLHRICKQLAGQVQLQLMKMSQSCYFIMCGELYLATGWEQIEGYFCISKVSGKDQTVWPNLILWRSGNWKWQFIAMEKFPSL